MHAEVATTYRAARRAYELGRFVVAMRRAALVALAVAVFSGLMIGERALVWLPVTFAVVALCEWRGAVLMSGGRRGVLAGFASMLVPLSLLRPCCGIDAKAMGATCCVMPSACWGVGAVVGLAMALLVPSAPAGKRTEAALGMVLGVVSVAVMRCSMLFLGEALGLLGGITAGLAAASLARGALQRSRAAT